MESDITKFLSYEIKKELAERYFGFRKLIEEDKDTLKKDLRHSNQTIGNRIVLDLSRLYILLQDESLIDQFLNLTGLGEKFFYDPYILTSPTIRARVFSGVKAKGLTASGRFKNLLMCLYEALIKDIEEYRERLTELIDSQKTIEEEIKIFSQNNDIGSIIGFLRNIDGDKSTHGSLEGGISSGFSESLENKMKVPPPPRVIEELPILPPLTPLPQIKKEIKKLAEQAFKLHKNGFSM
jgi:hypothetical protein